MTISRLVAVGDRTRTSAVLGGLVAIVVLFAAVLASPVGAATTTTNNSVPVLAQGAGMSAKPSAAVRRVQHVLARQGYDLGTPGVDGRFGPLTAAAVRHLQEDYGLGIDGVVGARTRKLLDLAAQRRQGSRSSSQKGPATGSPRPTPAAPAAPRPATVVVNRPSRDRGWLLAGAAGTALGALLATVAALAQGTRRWHDPPTPLAAIDRELYVEGRSDDERVGEFRGHALAASFTGPTADASTDYLVDDPRKAAPVWVRGSEIRRSPSRLAAGERVIGYVTMPPDGHRTQTEAATHAIEEACRQADLELVEVVTDRETGRSLERPGLGYALERIAEGEARGLVVCDLQPLSRSIVDLGTLLEWFRDAQAALIALDLDIDTSTPVGDQLAGTLITLSEWGRERIAQRTRSGLAEIRASGQRVGRPAVSDQPDLADRIHAMRAAGMTLQAISDRLNGEGVPTLRGGAKWRPSSVQAALGYRRPSSRSPRDQLPSLEDRDRT
jgi:DNA invertase Pin-like site-specific DNA recombinase/peptidoglycan hydrolase-like protein with peptidoglycan-binding domain